MDFLLSVIPATIALVLSLSISGASADVACGPILRCPNIISGIASALTEDNRQFDYCCHRPGHLDEYSCCDWKDYAVNFVGLDHKSLAIPVGAIIGIVIGGIVLMILFCVCCCFCCGLCCFRGRKRVVTQHRTVAFAPTTTTTITTTPSTSPYAPLSSQTSYVAPPPYNPNHPNQAFKK